MTILSLTGKRWIVPDDGSGRDVIASLLQSRGVEALGQGELIDAPGHDALLFRDFAAAAARINDAVEKKETIGIVGDYDCDGITGAAILARFFRRRGMQPRIRLPHRIKEGYGLKKHMVDELGACGVTLLLTVDTGVTAGAEITYAKKKGIDVIVLDHHHLPQTLPPAVAVLHPGVSTAPMIPAPCGAGVAWSVVRALEGGDWDESATDMALAAIGTIADVVPLQGGNRTLVHQGLMALQALPPGPLQLLCIQAGLQAPYTARDIAFRIAPRINAAGRMADPAIALQALLGNQQALFQLEELNRTRQETVSEYIEELLPRAQGLTTAFLCFADARFSPGICGLLAGKLTERFGKPSLVACIDGETCVASLRSVPSYHVMEGLLRTSALLTGFGGHAMAAGCSFSRANFESLAMALQDDLQKRVEPALLTPSLRGDAVLHPEQLTMELREQLECLEPYGEGNPEPRFVLQSIQLRDLRAVGKTASHLQGSASGHKIIGFGLGNLLPHLAEPVDLLCRMGIDTWQGARRLQLFVDDIRLAEKVQAQRQGRKKVQSQTFT